MGTGDIAQAGGAAAEHSPEVDGGGDRAAEGTEGLATDLRLRVKELQEAADRMCKSLEARIADLLRTSAEAQRRLAEETSAWESTRAALAERHEQTSARVTVLEERLAVLTGELATAGEAKGDAERGRDEALQRLVEQTNDRAALEHELETLRAGGRGESLLLRLRRLVRSPPENPEREAPNRREPSPGTQETVPAPVEALKTSSEPYLLSPQDAFVEEAPEPAGEPEAHSFEMGVCTTCEKLGKRHVEGTGDGNSDSAPGRDHEFVNSVCLRCGIMEAYVRRYGAACRPGEIFIPPRGSKLSKRR